MTARPQIVLVLGIGGPALDYALPRLARRGDVHVLCVVDPSPFNRRAVEACAATVVVAPVTPATTHAELVTAIERFARGCGADAVLTFSEYAVHAVADACERLGLRGAGPDAMRSRDKWAMRSTWERAAVPGPRFVRVDDVEDLRRACDILDLPFLLKPALSAGSIGQQIVRGPEDVAGAYARSRQGLRAAADEGDIEYGAADVDHLLAEDIIRSSSDGWYDDPRYGDYVSVEGIVADGAYHPICITSRLPTIAPFTELSNQAPCVLPEALQRAIEATARAAVDALELGTCATHTEIKLMPGGGLSMIESAARLPGAMVVREVEEAWGVDLIGALADALLGNAEAIPASMLVTGARRAAASLALIATDSAGRPWASLPILDPARISWCDLVSPDTTVEIVEAQTLELGSRMPRYEASAGVLNFAGLLFVVAPDAATLLDDTLAILDGLEAQLTRPEAAGAVPGGG